MLRITGFQQWKPVDGSMNNPASFGGDHYDSFH